MTRTKSVTKRGKKVDAYGTKPKEFRKVKVIPRQPRLNKINPYKFEYSFSGNHYVPYPQFAITPPNAQNAPLQKNELWMTRGFFETLKDMWVRWLPRVPYRVFYNCPPFGLKNSLVSPQVPYFVENITKRLTENARYGHFLDFSFLHLNVNMKERVPLKWENIHYFMRNFYELGFHGVVQMDSKDFVNEVIIHEAKSVDRSYLVELFSEMKVERLLLNVMTLSNKKEALKPLSRRMSGFEIEFYMHLVKHKRKPDELKNGSFVSKIIDKDTIFIFVKKLAQLAQ